MTLKSTGIRTRSGGAHTARTMMLAELEMLLCRCGSKPIALEAYRKAIVEGNCLGKRSTKSRALTFRHLKALYGLDHEQLVFFGLLHFWDRDPAARPMLALCACLARDGWLASVAPEIWRYEIGAAVSRGAVEGFIEQRAPEHFSQAMRKSLAQNINSTLTQSGHLAGRSKKLRTQARTRPVAIAYALLLSHASGARGPALFQTVYAEALDCGTDEAIAMAEIASRRGWIRFNRVGEVMEVAFPNIISSEELERLHEQD